MSRTQRLGKRNINRDVGKIRPLLNLATLPTNALPGSVGGTGATDAWILPILMLRGGSLVEDWYIHSGINATYSPWWIFDSSTASDEEVWGGSFLLAYTGTMTITPIGGTRHATSDTIDCYAEFYVNENGYATQTDNAGYTSIAFTGSSTVSTLGLITDMTLTFTMHGVPAWIYGYYTMDHTTMNADFDFYGWYMQFS